MEASIQEYLPVLVFIQAHLDEDLSLERVAGIAGHAIDQRESVQ